MAPTRPAGPNDLILFEKWMDTAKWLFMRTHRMPAVVRHSLTQRLESLTLSILEDITTAAYRKGPLRNKSDDRPRRRRPGRFDESAGRPGAFQAFSGPSRVVDPP